MASSSSTMASSSDASSCAQEETPSRDVFGRFAGNVDSFFQAKFHSVGHFVGTRPALCIAISLGVSFVFSSGFSQINAESRPYRLWIPQDTQAQKDQGTYSQYFPPSMRMNSLLLEAKSGSVLDKAFLQGVMAMHEEIASVTTSDDTFTSVCVAVPTDGQPCFISSLLGVWSYNATVLDADTDPLATVNAAGMSQDDLRGMLGGLTFSGGGADVESAQAMLLTYWLQNARTENANGFDNPASEKWEEEMLTLLGCDSPNCDDDDVCPCSYDSAYFSVFARAERSWSDVFGDAITGDRMLISLAFMIMIVYLVINLGGLCHKIQSRTLLAVVCTLSILLSLVAGHGLAMWLGFLFSPAHSILPFVILGIGVDDSFVIMNAFDRTDPSLPVSDRVATAISHAGVSIMVTSLTDVVAFSISVSSALPALSSFCMYAALSVLLLFFLQIFFFAALVTLDARRVQAGRVDCCFCLPKGFPCCPTAPPEEVAAAIQNGNRDPNQLCCAQPGHKGGHVGHFMEVTFTPQLVRPPVTTAVVAMFVGFFGVCCWQASELSVQDTFRQFIPDDSYLQSNLNKMDEYFGTNGQPVDIVTFGGDYYAAQGSLASISDRLGELDFVKPATADTFRSWAEAFQAACMAGSVPQCDASSGLVTGESVYYNTLATWLQGAGARYAGDVVWVDEADPPQGIKASRFSAVLEAMRKMLNGRLIVDADRAIEAMDALREACNNWNDMPGGGAMPYSYIFLQWETFRIIKRELFMSVGLCLGAVFIIALVLLAHPHTAVLVFLTVVMTVVDILGCMHVWGLAIDSVSVIQLVIAVGLCIDYAAHVGHSFMLHDGSRSQRVIKTMGDVGAAVMCGGISTFLGVMMLAASKSYVFRVLFQSFFLTVVLGLGHGLVLLPALLAVVGPDSYQGSTAVIDDIPAKKVDGAVDGAVNRDIPEDAEGC